MREEKGHVSYGESTTFRSARATQVIGGNKSWVTTALLCLFLGEMGIHRFYTGHIIIGLFQFFTFGGFGIWTLVDLILIYTDNYTDSNGMRLTRM